MTKEQKIMLETVLSDSELKTKKASVLVAVKTNIGYCIITPKGRRFFTGKSIPRKYLRPLDDNEIEDDELVMCNFLHRAVRGKI